ncbi:MAG: ATP-dependent helicase [Acidilobaceae archaeon]
MTVAVTLTDREILSMLRPYVREWFSGKYGAFTEPQRLAIPLIKSGRNVLISSPTGTGKTLAAFLGIIDELFSMGENGGLEDYVYVVYVSPLRALNNDVRRNLLEPMSEIRETAARMGYELPEVRVAVRTSDTSQSEKQRMARKPPHILITTPESLAVSLVAPRFRDKLSRVRWVIVDEIHDLASSKRGAHLMLSLERLEWLVSSSTGRGFQRIGLSATIAPLEVVASFLGGFDDEGRPRSVEVVDARFSKPIDIRVVVPDVDIIDGPPDKVNESIYKKLAELIESHRTTLVFTNTRSATERVVFKLKRILSSNGLEDLDRIEAHHSSISRDLRLSVEERLKRGELKVVVSSTSLELGIDIGYIDLVALLGSPKSTTRLLQRVGRAGHRITEVSKGAIIVVDRDDLVECSVLAKSAMERAIDSVKIPEKPLDVLAQHIVGMSVERRWSIDEAYRLVRRAYNYRNLTMEEFMSVLRYLAGRYESSESLEAERVYAKIWLDEEERVFGRKRGARMIYQLNSGVIPDEAKIEVVTTSGRYVGNLEEGFVEILVPGDIFVLGGRTYKFLKSEGLLAVVEPVEGAKPTVPTWYSEMLPLSFESALRVGRFRRRLAQLLREGREEEARRELEEVYRLQPEAAKIILDYVREQLEYVGEVPGDDLILVEYFWDSEWSIVFHTLYGRRVNDALSRALAAKLSERILAPVRITVTDNGFMLSYDAPIEPSRELIEEVLGSLSPESLWKTLEEAVENTELFKKRFRHVAERSFMILRRYKGKEKSPDRLQLSAEKLAKVLLAYFRHLPPVRETFREILEDYMDIENARRVLEWLREGRIKVAVAGPLEHPSPMAHSIVVKSFSDVVLMEDRRRLLKALRERILEAIKSRKRAPET